MAIVREDKSESLDIPNSLGLSRDRRSRAISPSLQTQPILCATHLQPRSDFVAAENAAEGRGFLARLRFTGCDFNDARTDCNVTLKN